MAYYLGFYRPTAGFIADNQERARNGDLTPNPRMQRLVAELPEKLPAGAKVLAAFAPIQSGNVFSEAALPGVIALEADSPAPLQYIQQHYAGYLMFQWTPATSVGLNRTEREAMQAQNMVAR